MNFLIKLGSTFAIALVLQLFLPWWTIAIAAFLVAAFSKGSHSLVDFLAGFLAIFLLWSVCSFIIDYQTNSILSGKIAQIFSLGNSPFRMILFTGFLGGIVAGFSALSGNLFYKWIRGKSEDKY